MQPTHHLRSAIQKLIYFIVAATRLCIFQYRPTTTRCSKHFRFPVATANETKKNKMKNDVKFSLAHNYLRCRWAIVYASLTSAIIYKQSSKRRSSFSICLTNSQFHNCCAISSPRPQNATHSELRRLHLSIYHLYIYSSPNKKLSIHNANRIAANTIKILTKK